MLTRFFYSPGKNTGEYSLLQGIFLTQGSNPGLLHCWQPLYCLSYQGSHSFGAVKLIFTLINRTICHMNCQASRGLQCRSKHRNEGMCAAKVTTPYSKYFSIGGDFALFPGDICHCFETFWVVIVVWQGVNGLQQGEARDPAKHPITDKTVSITKDYPSQMSTVPKLKDCSKWWLRLLILTAVTYESYSKGGWLK